jgi:hypothetical protein
MPQLFAPNAFVGTYWVGILAGAIVMWALVVFSRRPLFVRNEQTLLGGGRPDAVGMFWRFLVILLLAVVLAALEEMRAVDSVTTAALTGALIMLLPIGYHVGRASRAGSIRADIAHIGFSALGGTLCAVIIYLLRHAS